MPANFYLNFLLLWVAITSPVVKNLIRWRQSRGLAKLPPSFGIWKKENQYLVVSVPETEYPCFVPSNVTACGPILLPERSVSEQDPKLDAWLKAAPTVLINLGSHIRMEGETIRQFALGLRIVLLKMRGIQVLWKLKTSGGVAVLSNPGPANGDSTKGDEPQASLEVLEPWISNGQVKVLEWLSVDPLAVLRNENVICSVHQLV